MLREKKCRERQDGERQTDRESEKDRERKRCGNVTYE